MKKRILSMVLSVIMVLSLVPMTAFATESGMEEYAIQIPIKITVAKGGNVTPPAVDFELELYDFSAPPKIDINESITVSGSTVSTNSENTYDAVLTVTPNDEQIMSFLSDGFYIRQKQGNAEHWTYSDAAYFIRPYSGDDGLTTEIIIFDEETSTEQSFVAAEFVNTYTENIAPHTHEWSTEWSSDETHHWHECTAEGCYITDNSQKNKYEEHTPEADDGDCTTEVKCSVCGYVLVEAKQQHSFKNYEYDNNASYEKDGTETATCDNEGCNVTHTRTKEGTKLEAKTVTVGDFVLISDASLTEADYSFEDGVLTLIGNGPYTLKMKEGVTKTSNRVVIASTGNITLTLDGVNIDCGEIENAAAMLIDKNAGNVTLILSGTNTLQSGNYCAGLQKDSGENKNLTIKGYGSLTAIGGYNGAGIGGGQGGNGANITISGGTVAATGGGGGAGIGGGDVGDGTNITVSGGTVKATGGNSGAGIGGGSGGNGTNITISGGTVAANGGNSGAGIGGGSGGNGTNITVFGGTITANGGEKGAGIGGGMNDNGTNITISGGTITANGGEKGAGIGGGWNGNGINITISGGTVTANGGINSEGFSNDSAGIGGGWNGNGTNITISGGIVTAKGGNNGAGTGIGGGQRSGNIKLSVPKGKFGLIKNTASGVIYRCNSTENNNITGLNLQSLQITFTDEKLLAVTFNMGGKAENIDVVIPNDGKVTPPEVPKVEGYDFLGWYTSSDCKAKWNPDIPVTESMTVYAGWRKQGVTAVSAIVPGATKYEVTSVTMASSNISDTDKLIVEDAKEKLVSGSTAGLGYDSSTVYITDTVGNTTPLAAFAKSNPNLIAFAGNISFASGTHLFENEALLSFNVGEENAGQAHTMIHFTAYGIQTVVASADNDGIVSCSISSTSPFILIKGEYTVSETPPTTDAPTSPQTGDNSNMLLWVALLFVSGTALVGTTVYGRKKRKVR